MLQQAPVSPKNIIIWAFTNSCTEIIRSLYGQFVCLISSLEKLLMFCKMKPVSIVKMKPVLFDTVCTKLLHVNKMLKSSL